MEQMITWDDVREIALRLPGVEDGMSYGAPALKVGGKHLIVRWREDLNAIVVKTTFDEREGLIAEEPDVYFITDHYLNYEWVLINLATVPHEAVEAMIRRAHQLAKSAK
jgi:hypothetical protein